jgi:hypothetical protein
MIFNSKMNFQESLALEIVSDLITEDPTVAALVSALDSIAQWEVYDVILVEEARPVVKEIVDKCASPTRSLLETYYEAKVKEIRKEV